jgi:transcriptional regulator with XRE-family HTH domain
MKGEDLKQWRKANDFTQARLASLLGVTVTTASRWETDQAAIPPFLHLALRCIELEKEDRSTGATGKRK